MRVLLAPDCFTGTLSAAQVADALAEGWRRGRPGDHLVLQPLSDGGPGFLDAFPGTRVAALVADPLHRPTSAAFVLDGTTAYVEAAQAVGLHLLEPQLRDPGTTTTFGVGQLVLAAVEAGATHVVLGLGGTATNDGGAGLLAALGLLEVPALRAHCPVPALMWGAYPARVVGNPDGSRHVLSRGALEGVALVAATDVSHPLLGAGGATRVFGPQKGATPAQVERLETAMGRWADALEAELGVAVRDRAGAGAAGGLGFALLALGATRTRGLQLVAEAVGLSALVEQADLVVTGEGRLDSSSLQGKVVSGVAGLAAERGVPCVVVAGEVQVGRRRAAAAGIVETVSLVELVGGERALQDAAGALAHAAADLADRWAR